MCVRGSKLFLLVLLAFSLPFGAGARQAVTATVRTLPPVTLPVFMRSFAFASENMGQITITGTTFDPAFPDDENRYSVATLRYNTAGRRLWVTPFDGHGLEDQASQASFDGKGNFFVTGFSEFATNAFEAVTLKYTKTGAPVWTNRFQADPSFTTGLSVAEDGHGNTAVIVRTFTNNILAKLDKDGALVWQADLGQPAPTSGLAVYVATFDRPGNVLVSGTGYSVDGLSNSVVQTIKFSPRGVALWTNRYDESLRARPTGIITDRHGQSFVVVAAAPSSPQWGVVSYGPGGRQQWSKFLDSGPLDVGPSALTIDRLGSIYMGGTTSTGAVRVVKFRNNGQLRWDRNKATPISGESSLRFGRVTPHQLTVFQDGVTPGTVTPEPIWTRVQIRYVGGL